MKADSVIVLVILLAASKATKFSRIHASYKGDENDEAEMNPATLKEQKEEVPVSADALGEVQEGCDFCTDYMLSDCMCEDVNFCKSRSCYVPDKCNSKNCDENENEEEVPVTTNTVGEVQEGCDFCTDYMLSDCPCEDVNFCKSRSCYVPDKCNSKNCDENENEEEVPVTTNTVGEVQEGCDFCTDYMLSDCMCEDVNFCKSRSCYVPDKCNSKNCDENEEEEEEVPVTTNTVGEVQEGLPEEYGFEGTSSSN